MLFTILTLSLLSSALTSGKDKVVLKALKSKSIFSGLLGVHLKEFHKHYSKPELRTRARVFRKALEQVADCNEHAHFHCHTNQFSTMTGKEKHQYLGLANITAVPAEAKTQPRLATRSTVSSKDWRRLNAVTPVTNQGSCGSCWAFSATAAVEGTYAITAGKLRKFSDQELLECTFEGHDYDGCMGGWYFNAFEYLKKSQHFSSAKTLPYEGYDGQCRNWYENSMIAAKVTGYVKANQDDHSLAAAIELTPVSVAMLASDNFFSYSDGLYDGYYDCYGATFPNHALTAVAFTQTAFVIKNSWGKTWGDGGYINIARGRNVCFVNDYVYYPTMEKTGEDTQPTDSTNPTDRPEPSDKCKAQEYDDDCIDINARDCPGLKSEGRCYEDYMLSYTKPYCAKSCGFCNNIPLQDLAEDCVQRISDNSCSDTDTKLVCPKSCCDKESGGKDDHDNGGCPSGTTRCSDGSCKHEHMCEHH